MSYFKAAIWLPFFVIKPVFETVKESILSKTQNAVVNMELYSRIIGPTDAEPVVVIHGLFGASDNLMALGKALAEKYSVHILDVRNHGKSPHSDCMTYASMVDDVHEYLSTHSLPYISLIGHSMGGKIAMKFSLTYPNCVNRLIVADIAPVSYSSHHVAIFRAFDALDLGKLVSRSEALKIFSAYIDEPSVSQFLIKSLDKKPDGGFEWRFNLNVIRENYQHIISDDSGSSSFSGPVLFISGDQSDYVLAEHRARIIGLFPNVVSKRMQGVGHWLHAQKPAVFNNLCLRFLDS